MGLPTVSDVEEQFQSTFGEDWDKPPFYQKEPETQEPYTELLEILTDLMEDQDQYAQWMRPFMLEGMQLRPTYDDDGNMIGIEKIPYDEWMEGLSPAEQQSRLLTQATTSSALVSMGIDPNTGNRFESEEAQLAAMSPQQRQLYELESIVIERETAALKGELPVSAALERELAEFETTDIEATRRRLGSLDIASSAGIEAAGRREETGIIAREAARFGQLGTLEQMRSSISGGIASGIGANLGAYGLSSNISQGISPSRIGQFGGIISSFGQPASLATSGYGNIYGTQAGLSQSAMQGKLQFNQTMADFFGNMFGGGSS